MERRGADGRGGRSRVRPGLRCSCGSASLTRSSTAVASDGRARQPERGRRGRRREALAGRRPRRPRRDPSPCRWRTPSSACCARPGSVMGRSRRRALAIARKETRQLLRDPVVSRARLRGAAAAHPAARLSALARRQGPAGGGRRPRPLPVEPGVHRRLRPLRVLPARRACSTARPRRREWIRSGRARVVSTSRPTSGGGSAPSEPAVVGVTVDGSFPTRGQIVIGLRARRSARSTTNGSCARISPGEARATGRVVAGRRWTLSVWYNPALESKNFIVPGMLVVILMIFPPLLSALLIVRERESGTILNLYCSPAGRVGHPGRQGAAVRGRLVPRLPAHLRRQRLALPRALRRQRLGPVRPAPCSTRSARWASAC